MQTIYSSFWYKTSRHWVICSRRFETVPCGIDIWKRIVYSLLEYATTASSRNVWNQVLSFARSFPTKMDTLPELYLTFKSKSASFLLFAFYKVSLVCHTASTWHHCKSHLINAVQRNCRCFLCELKKLVDYMCAECRVSDSELGGTYRYHRAGNGHISGIYC
jgi:hypothetical protein